MYIKENYNVETMARIESISLQESFAYLIF